MSEIPNFWPLAIISLMPPYLLFIAMSKSTFPGNMCLYHKTHISFTNPLHYKLACLYAHRKHQPLRLSLAKVI